MTVKVITPALPMPIKTLPVINTVKVCACEQTSEPSVRKKATGRTRLRGEKMVDNRPATGARDEVAMRYEEVNHMASSYASSSSAMMDWVMVMPDMLDAVSHLSMHLDSTAVPLPILPTQPIWKPTLEKDENPETEYDG